MMQSSSSSDRKKVKPSASKKVPKEELDKEDERRRSSLAPHPRDLATFVPYACKQLASFDVLVSPHLQDEPSVSRDSDSGERAPLPDTTLTLTTVHDPSGALVELAAHHHPLSWKLLKIIAMCAPHQTRLTRLTLRACTLDAPALHQLVELQRNSNISELCLDDSHVRAGGYHILLEHPSPSNLTCLSLDRCSLGDSGAVAIAEYLQHPRPASSTLRVLSLATNAIGDFGATAFGEALRSNRGLQYLNLADNRISDVGAKSIFDSLGEFELTREEIIGARGRVFDRLRRRQSIYARVLAELEAQGPRSVTAVSSTTSRRLRRGNTSSVACGPYGDLSERAEATTEHLLGPSGEPYAAEYTKRGGDNKVFCLGNTTLRWLDLAYNGLGQASLVLLKHLLTSQAEQRPPPPIPIRGGLLRVVLEGNPLPWSNELNVVAGRLEEALDRATQRPQRKQTLKGKVNVNVK